MTPASTEYRELIIELTQAHTEALSEVLFEIDGILSVSIEDAQADQPQEQALFGEPDSHLTVHAWQHSLITILIDNDIHIENLINTINQALATRFPPITLYQIRSVIDQDWVRTTQSQFTPIAIGKRIWVVPSWHEAPQHDHNAIILELDPGQAFGTGSHPTTRLCLEWLEIHAHTINSVLDYGCGSGILAIAAKKLGTRQVSGIDIDPKALVAAQENSKKNHTEIEYFLPNTLPAQSFDLVLANILSNPLKLMAGLLSSKVKINGHLVLSGILSRQAEEVIACYAPWLKLNIWKEQEGWVCLAGQKVS